MSVSREDITLVLMPWLSHEFMESCPSRHEHWVTCVTAASLIGGVFGGGGVCERGCIYGMALVWMWGLAFLTCLRWYLLYREGLFASGRLTGF